MRREAWHKSETDQPAALLAWGLVPVVAVAALNLAPPAAADRLRALVREGLAPGLHLIQQTMEPTRHFGSHQQHASSSPGIETNDVQAALSARNRSFELQLAALRERLAIAEKFGRRPRPAASEPLLIPELIEARWLGEELATLVRAKSLIAAGSADALTESALVLRGGLPMLDLGVPQGLQAGDPVYAGRVVIGKIAEVGRQVSTFRRVTDPEYSGRARIARRTDRGLELVAEGTLVGDGPGRCRLRHVTEAVAIGDEVYSGGQDGVVGYPMYYGRVTAAEPNSASREWTVIVTPAADETEHPRLEVLRLSLNSQRSPPGAVDP